MSLIIESNIIRACEAPELDALRSRMELAYKERAEIMLRDEVITDALLGQLLETAIGLGSKKTERVLRAVIAARAGDFSAPMPSFRAFAECLKAYLIHHAQDGWIYVDMADGTRLPYLVRDLTQEWDEYGREKSPPSVRLTAVCYGISEHRGDPGIALIDKRFTFFPGDVVRGRIEDVLKNASIHKESPALRDGYDKTMLRYQESVRDQFTHQFRVTGRVLQQGHRESFTAEDGVGRRVVHDLPVEQLSITGQSMEVGLFDDVPPLNGYGALPVHPYVHVFDLKAHSFAWVHSDHLQPYTYDKSLRDKLVLPATHRDLLDVLTTDIKAFVGDFVEGKSAGNVILCKGVPGVGKTLTAEVYAELIERPLYCVHSGTLGTSAGEIQRNLQVVFERSKRWSAPLLIDEADIFVMQRGDDIRQNAIVAEFLRTLEYFDGLLFMTSNRGDDIDEAILSRCAAIINYAEPGPEDARAIWRVMSDQFNAEMSDTLIADLVELFPKIRPRDIKMLLRLALRVSIAAKEQMSLETFRRCAMFRAIEVRAEPATDKAAAAC